MPRPATIDYAPYYETYVSKVPEADVLPVLRSEIENTLAFLRGVPAAEETRLHAPYTWTFRQVLGHLIDAERIFAYRAVRFARGDTTPLPGFDEGPYVFVGEFDRLPLAEWAAEFEAVRRTTVMLFEHLPASAWERRGVASDAEMSVRALAYCIAGHERHHVGILRKRLGMAHG
jgi:hypothetical protein